MREQRDDTNLSSENTCGSWFVEIRKEGKTMLVGERMTQPVITVRPDTPILDAYGLMQKEKIRRLPVVDKKGNLIGMLAEREILHASPSQATSLSIWELNYLMSRVTVNEIMTSDVVTVNVDTPLEEAAMIMA
ncbi:MAG: CBS domain-containing protein, partial [Anaerolineales bacterium]|nr:CBS domain-containing protein [Anaerolineales bacterium]